MIDVVEKEVPTLEEVEAIVSRRLGPMPSRVYRGDDGSVRVRLKTFTKSPRGADPAEYTSRLLTQLSARCLSTAEEIKAAAGYIEAPELIPLRDNQHHFEIPGFEYVEVVVHNANSQDEALQVAYEAIASISPARLFQVEAEDVSKEKAEGTFPTA